MGDKTAGRLGPALHNSFLSIVMTISRKVPPAIRGRTGNSGATGDGIGEGSWELCRPGLGQGLEGNRRQHGRGELGAARFRFDSGLRTMPLTAHDVDVFVEAHDAGAASAPGRIEAVFCALHHLPCSPQRTPVHGNRLHATGRLDVAWLSLWRPAANDIQSAVQDG